MNYPCGDGIFGNFSYAILLIAMLALFGCDRDKPKMSDMPKRAEEQTMKTIVAVGDSLTAGLGLAEEESYPAQLEKKLQADGYSYRVINAGVSAETSSGTLARLDWVLFMNPDIVILETGANDGLRGIDPALVESNIREALEILRGKDVVVILAGMKMVQNLGPAYVAGFNRVYPKLAEEFKPVFVPFILEGVAMQRALNQSDTIHPNGQGYKKIVDNIYPYVLEAIKRREGR